MINYIALSKVVTIKSPANSGGGFQKNFWLKFNNKSLYDEKKKSIYLKLKALGELDQEYFSIKINKKKSEKNIAKSNIPKEVWKESGIEISGINDNLLLGNGNKDSINKLLSLIQKAKFSHAKENSGSKKTTLSREIFTIEDINSVALEDRISEDLKNIDHNSECDIVLELYSEIKYQKAQSIINKINDFLTKKSLTVQSIIGVDSEIISNVSIRVLINYNFLIDLLNICPEIQYSYLSPEIVLQRAMKNSISVTRNEKGFLTDCIIGVFDQGISEVFNFAIRQKQKYENDSNMDHGTLVASKILFGDQLNRSNLSKSGNINLDPVGKILDIKVLNQDGGINDINIFYDIIETIIIKYHNVYIYNISLGFPQDKNHIHMLTTIIDNLASKYDKIFVISTGNSDGYNFLKSTDNESYGDIIKYLYNDSTHLEVLAPADSINGISVGSVVEITSDETISKSIGEISPLSRIGLIRNGIVIRKPDLVEVGSNHKYSDLATDGDDEQLGTVVINQNSDLQGTRGTSFSAPIITNKCAQILDFFEKTQIHDNELEGNRLNLVKGLLLHKTALHKESAIIQDMDKMYYGYGKPGSIEGILTDPIHSFTFVHFDNIEITENINDTIDKIHEIEFNIPNLPDNQELLILCTLSYNPPVNKDFPSEYAMININSSVKVNNESISRFIYRHKDVHSPIKTFLFKNKKRENTNIIKVRLQTLVSDYFRKRMLSSHTQHYSLFMTVYDPNGTLNIRDIMINTQQFEIIQPIQIAINNSEF